MAPKRPSAKWTGVIEFPELSFTINGGLYSTSRRGRTPLPITLIHTQCQTKLPEPLAEDMGEEGRTEQVEEQVEAAESAVTQITKQVHCPTCNRFPRLDEIGRAVETDFGLLQITDDEFEELKPKKQKIVSAHLIQDVTGVLTTIGIGRRFYLFPKAPSTADYYLLFEVLQKSGRVGFIREIVVDKRSYVVVVRPIITHSSVFGKSRKLLVVDEFVDTNTLCDPDEYQLLPAQEPPVQEEVIAEKVAAAKKIKTILNPDECVNPQRRHLKEIMERKLQARRVL